MRKKCRFGRDFWVDVGCMIAVALLLSGLFWGFFVTWDKSMDDRGRVGARYSSGLILVDGYVKH